MGVTLHTEGCNITLGEVLDNTLKELGIRGSYNTLKCVTKHLIFDSVQWKVSEKKLLTVLFSAAPPFLSNVKVGVQSILLSSSLSLSCVYTLVASWLILIHGKSSQLL